MILVAIFETKGFVLSERTFMSMFAPPPPTDRWFWSLDKPRVVPRGVQMHDRVAHLEFGILFICLPGIRAGTCLCSSPKCMRHIQIFPSRRRSRKSTCACEQNWRSRFGRLVPGPREPRRASGAVNGGVGDRQGLRGGGGGDA